jgi:hypothetical protein
MNGKTYSDAYMPVKASVVMAVALCLPVPSEIFAPISSRLSVLYRLGVCVLVYTCGVNLIALGDMLTTSLIWMALKKCFRTHASIVQFLEMVTLSRIAYGPSPCITTCSDRSTEAPKAVPVGLDSP